MIKSRKQFEINCGSRGFHKYKNIWICKLNEKLEVVNDSGNLYDSCAMALYIKTRRTIDGHQEIRHLPKGITAFKVVL